MASLAHLSREERLGLGIAVAAHVALVAALVLQVGDKPTALPIPERIEVSLADDVSLTQTAPNPVPESQAAVAPLITDRPAPPPAPEPVRTTAPRTTPVQSPRQSVTRPTLQNQRTAPAQTPAAQRPAPPATRPGGSRLGNDFLAGAGSSERTENTTAPATTFGPAEQASLRSAISRELRPHWNAPQGVDVEKLVTMLDWDLNPDGSLAGRPRLRSQAGINDANRPQAQRHAELAIRAVTLAAPFNLPEEYYEHWRRIRNWRFDRNTDQ